jgi:hypothetical protein
MPSLLEASLQPAQGTLRKIPNSTLCTVFVNSVYIDSSRLGFNKIRVSM